jgi:hypothetical protein
MRNALRALGHEASYAVRRLKGQEREALAAAAHLGRSKRLIFCITNGRSGTATLASHLLCISGLSGGHERPPKMLRVMRWAQLCPGLARDFLLYSKLPDIAKQPGHIYAETNHLFGKGFFEPLLDLGVTPSLILLKRDRRRIAQSLYELGTIPGRTKIGLKWYLSPDDTNLLDLPDWRRMTDYQLCYWHTLEMEARQERYGAMARAMGAPCVEVDIEDLNRPHGFETLAGSLGLSLNTADLERASRLVGLRANHRIDQKRRNLSELGSVHAEECEVERRIRRHPHPRPQIHRSFVARYAQPVLWRRGFGT